MALLAVPWVTQAQVPIPYNEGFETMSSADDLTTAGWISYQSSTGSFLAIETTASNVHTGSKALNIDSWNAGSTSDYIIVGLPLVEEAINGLQITFSYKVSTGTVNIGYLTDANDASTFVSLQQFSSSSSYSTQTVELNEAPDDAARIAIKYTNWYRCYVDDILVEALPTCFKPTFADNAVSNITTTGATITWTSTNDASATFTFYNGDEAIATDITPVADGENVYHYNLTGLTPSTNYNNLTIVAHCGGEDYTDPVAVPAFATACEAEAIPYVYGFETADDMLCWTNDNTNGSGVYNSADYSRTGDNCFMFNYTTTPPLYLISPELSGIENGLHVEFYYRRYTNGQETFHVGYSTTDTDPESFTWGDEIANATTEYQRFSANYPAGTKYVAVKFTSDDQYYLFLDDFTFEESASCLEPTAVAAADETTTSATLSWTAGGEETAWDIFVTNDNTVVPEETTTPTYAGVSTNPYGLTGLTQATTYYVYVRAACAAEEVSAWSSPVIFHTECDAMTLPYTYGFEDAALPVCWNTIVTNTSYTGISIESEYAHDGENCLYFYRGSSDGTLIAVLPEVSGTYPLNGYEMTFWAMGNNPLVIGIMTDPTDAETFVQMGEQVDLTGTYTQYKVRFNAYTGEGHYIAIKNVHSTNGATVVDDIDVHPLPACFEPADLAITEPTAHGATFGWTAGAEEEAWQLYISTENEAPADDIDVAEVIAATSNPYTVASGLAPETPHYVWVRANCGAEGYSVWVGPETFTTGIACPAPSEIATTSITNNSAALTWTGSSESYEVNYRLPASFNGVSEQFATTAIPTGWTRSNTLLTDAVLNGTTQISSYSSGWSFGTSNGVFDSHARMNIYGTYKYWLITSELTVPTGGALNFDLALTAYSGTLGAPATTGTDDRFVVLITTDNQATWTILRQWDNAGSDYVYNNIACSATGENVNIDLSAYAGQTVKIAFYGESTVSNADNNLHIDNVAIGLPVPAGEWQQVDASTTTATLTGLTAQTKYEARVQGDCGEEGLSQWSSLFNFTTECDPVTEFPWTEDFENFAASTSGVVLSDPCWKNEHISGTGTNTFQVYSGNVAGNTSTNKLRLPSMAAGTLTKLRLPLMTLPNENFQFVLSVNRNATGTTATTEGIRVYASTNGEIEGAEELAFISRNFTVTDNALIPAEDASGWYTYELPIGIDGNIYIILQGESQNSSIIYLDDFSIESILPCKKVQDVAVTNANNTSTSAVLTVTDARNTGATYSVYDGTVDAEHLIASSTAAGDAENTYKVTLTGLTPNTTYSNLLIVANCAGTDGNSNPVEVPNVVTKKIFTDITAFNITTSGKIRTGEAVAIDAELHTVTVPVYYLSRTEIKALAGSITLASGATDSILSNTGWRYVGTNLNVLRDTLQMETPLQIRVYAEDRAVYQDWTIILMGEECNRPRNLALTPDHRRITAAWNCYDPDAEGFQVVINATEELDAEGLEAAEKTIVAADAEGNNSYRYTALTPSTLYHIYVRTACGSEWAHASATTGVAPDPLCPAVASVVCSDPQENAVTVTWEASEADYCSSYDVVVLPAAENIADFIGTPVNVTDALTYTYTGLNPYTEYVAYVRANCPTDPAYDPGEENTSSDWVPSGIIRTLSDCGIAQNIEATITGKTQATLTWDMAKPTQAMNFNYILSTTDYDVDAQAATLNGMAKTGSELAATEVVLNGLNYQTHYYFYIQNVCDATTYPEGASPWTKADFETYEPMPVVVDLNVAASDISYNAFKATWHRNLARFADEVRWQVAIVETGEDVDWAAENNVWVVEDSSFVFTGLEAESTYDVYVRAYLNSTATSLNAMTTATTGSLPSSCVTVGTGTSNGNWFLPGYWGYNYEAYLYEMPQGGNVSSLSFYLNTGNNTTGSTMKIWVKPVDGDFEFDASTNTFAILSDGATSVYDGTGDFPTSQAGNWIQIPFGSTVNVAEGQQLMVLVRGTGCTGSGGCSRQVRYGTVTGKQWQKRADNNDPGTSATGSKGNILPNMQFCFQMDPSCMPIVTSHIEVEPATRTATATWFPGATETNWVYYNTTEELTDSQLDAVDGLLNTSTRTLNLTGLEPETDYHFYVSPVCGEEHGAWSHVSYTTEVACGVPTLADATDITASTATLAVTPDEIGTPASYQFQYWIINNDLSCGDSLTATASAAEASTIIENLKGNTRYGYRVRTLCSVNSTDYSQWSASKDFRTECSALTLEDLPYNCLFTAAELAEGENPMPYCWTKDNSNLESAYPYVTAGALKFAAADDEVMFAVMPELDESLSPNTVQLLFNAYTEDGSDVQLYVGTRYLNSESQLAFRAPQQFTVNTDKQYRVVFNSAQAANDRLIAFRVTNPGVNVYIDNVTLRLRQACDEPMDLVSTGRTSESISLKWVKNCPLIDNPAGYVLKYGSETLNLTSDQVETEVDTVTYTLSGLAPSTTYGPFTVAANIDGTAISEYSAPLAAITTLSNKDSILAFNIAGDTIHRGDAIFGTDHNITMPVYYTNDFSGTTGTLSFSLDASVYFYDPVEDTLGEQVFTYYYLRDTMAMGRVLTLRVFAEDTLVYQDWTIALEAEACCTPRHLAFTNVERRSFTANWRANDPAATTFQVMFSDAAIDVTDAEAVEAATKFMVEGTSYTFTELDRGTEYFVYVRTACGSESYSDTWISGSTTTKTLTFCEDVVVADGTITNSNLPIYGYWSDADQVNQMIYPADMLADLNGKTLTSMKFFSTTDLTSWGTRNVTLKLAEIEANTLTGFVTPESWTTVYSDDITKLTDGFVMNFTTPYAYNGGNLLVEIDYESSTYVSKTFRGITRNNAGIYSYGSSAGTSGTIQNFLPKAQFQYCEENEACPAVAEVTVPVESVDVTTAVVNWTAAEGDYLSSYDLIYSTVEMDAEELDAYEGTYAVRNIEDLTTTLNGLSANTWYHVYVRANCGAPDNTSSTWVTTDAFKTQTACKSPVNLAVEQTAKTTMHATWNHATGVTEGNYQWVLSTDAELTDEDLNAMTVADGLHTGVAATEVDFTVTANGSYTFYLSNNCGDPDGVSSWVSATFDYDAMPAVVDLAVDQITHSMATISWAVNEAAFADETAWQVTAVASGLDVAEAEWTVVNETSHLFLALTPETEYDFYVRPYNAATEAFGTETYVTETTNAMPTECLTIGEGTTGNNSLPFAGYYNYSYTQQLFDEEEMNGQEGLIEGLKFNYYRATTTLRNVTVYMGTTEETSLATGWITPANMTEVFHAANVTFSNEDDNWFTLTLDEPFEYNGGNVVVAMYMNNVPERTAYDGTTRFYTTSVTGKARYYQVDGSTPLTITGGVISGQNGTASTNRDNIQFCFEPSECRGMTNVVVENVTTNSADVSWLPGNAETSWQYLLSEGETAEADRAALAEVIENAIEMPLTDLTADMDYHFYIRSICDAGNDEYSDWKDVAFSTMPTCGQPEVLAATDVTFESATLHANASEIGTPESFTFRYWKADATTAEDTVTAEPVVDTFLVITGLEPNTYYYYDVMVNCGSENGNSRWSEDSPVFRTKLQAHDLPYATVFDADRDQEWALENGERTNKWFIGSAASNTENERGLYISNDGGETNEYSSVANYFTYAYNAFNFEAGMQYTVSFDWRCNGSNGAYMRVYLAPEDAVIDATSTSMNSNGWRQLTAGQLKGQEEWTSAEFNDVAVTNDTMMYLVFVWTNNANAALQPAAAVDNVKIEESVKYTVSAEASLNDDEEPEATILGIGEYYVGTNATLTAEPLYGYHIVKWTTESGDSITNTPALVVNNITQDTTFNLILDSNIYTIYASSDHELGLIEGESEHSVQAKYNTVVTLHASAPFGLRANKWMEADTLYGSGNEVEIVASGNRNFSVQFDSTMYHITANVVESGMGTVNGAEWIQHFKHDSLEATANYGYHFVNWTDAENNVIGEAGTMHADGTKLYIDFRELEHDTNDIVVNANFDYDQFTVAAVSADVTMGTVEGTATENYLTTVTLTATPAEGYHLVNWMEADTVYATTEEVEVVANADRLFTANFAINTYTVTLLSEGTGHGTMTFTPTAGLVDNGDGTATVNYGTAVTIRAAEATCHSFVQWNTEATTRRIDTVITEDVTLTATFDSIEYSETVTENVCDMFEWKGETYTETPEVAPSVIEQTAAGCDSTVTLNLTVRHSSTGIDVQNMCGDYTWINGETYTETPAEAPIFTIENGNAELCDSVVTLNLTINRPVNTALTEVACESYTWEAGDGETYTESGDYTFSHDDAHGCTQVDTLHLTINNPVHTALTEVACESYTWEAGDGETYTESGDYLYEHLDANECTQVDTLHLTINTPVNAVLTMVACDSYTWTAGDGETYTESGDYFYEHLDANECAQVDTLYLTVNYSTTGTDVQTACDSYTWINGQTYNTNNMTAQFTIQNAAQCDSVVTLNLTINRSYTGTDYVASCDSAEWHDTWYYTSNNTATYTYEAANGCDSVITLNLTLSHSSTGELTEEVCNVFVFGGETYNESGVFTNDFYKNSEDCDSIVTLNLTILNCATTTLTVCDSYTWSVTGLTYTESGTYILGEDTLILTVNYSTSSIDEQTACSQYLWHGTVYTESTDDAVFSGSTAAGCDSTVTLHLTITGASTGIDEQTACDSYTWIDGLTYTENNNTATYTLTEADQNGCDSVVTLNLTINRSTTGDTAAVACDQFTWYGQTYTATPAVAPTHVFTNAAGCDSTVTLNLTINNSSTGVDEQTACNEYTWIDGETYTEVPAEAPTFTLTNAAGCDSVVTLNLTLNYSTTGDTTAVACDEFTWYGTTYTETPAEAPTHVFTNAAGCDSTVTLNLTINASANGDTTAVACDSFDWYEHTALTESSDNLTHVFEGVTAAGCDSTVTLHLTINLSTTGVETVAACGSYTWHEIEYTASTNEPTFTEEAANGCDSVVTLHLTINNPVNIAATRVACVSYTWNDSTYTESGDYLYEHLDANECTQVDTLHLTINVPENEVTNITQCGGSYTWYGVKYETSGDYTHQLLDDNNCTQVDTLHLTINTPVNTAMTDTACESYTWNDVTYTESGDYTYSHADSNGCTQVDTLHLTINTPVHTAMTEVACESYTWEAGDGETYTESGDYTFSHDDANGCTQVDTLHLTINNPVHGTETEVACNSYTWNDSTYTESGDYLYEHLDANECTQVDTLHLTINVSTTGDTTATACDLFTWYGTRYFDTPTTNPTHTFTGSNGCDSVVTLHLTINYSNAGIENATACDSFYWSANGMTYYQTPAVAPLTQATNIHGCDSTVTLNLTINYSNTGDTTAVACNSFDWYEHTGLTESSDNLTHVFTNAAGCDSVVTLLLTVNTSNTGVDVQTACDSYTWIDGETYTEVPAEAPTFTLTNAAGCDSVVTLNLTLNYSTTGDTSAVACDQFTWYGQTYTATPAVAPTHVFTNAAGCDSTVTLNLTINNSNTGVDEQTACNSYTWINGETYTEVPAEAPTFTLTNAAGCDSVVTLNLTLNYSNTGDTTAVACNSFTWYGQTYTATPAVAPTHVFTNAAGCDSVVTLNLTINQPMNTEETVTACVRYAWYGTLYNESGNYTHNIVDENGCNAVATLHLTITPSITVEVEETACDAYVWNDTVITESGVYTYNTTSATTNCDSTTILTLTITNTVNTSVDAVACGSYTWNGSTYTASGAYTYTTTSVSGCDSVVTLNLTINQSVATTVNEMACESYTWNGVTYTTSGAYVFDTIAANGCDSTVTLLLIVNMPTATTVEVTAEGSYEWNGEVLTESGTYTYTYTGSNGCDSVVTLNLTITVADFEVTVLSSDETRGSVSPAGVSHVAPGDFFTVTATARSGNQFVAWKVDNEVVSTEATYTFAVNADMTITAEFDTVLPQNYIISATVNDTSLGMVIGAGEYTAGSTVTLIARAKGTGRFVRWSTGETDSVLTFRATEDVSFVAIFVNTVGIDDIDETEVNIYAVDNQIVVKGAENQSIYIYDVNGRCVRHQATVTAETIEFTMTNTGVYLVKVGNAPAKRVVVLR